MAISDAASSQHGDWVQLYQRGLAGPAAAAASSPAAESTVVSTTSAGLAPADRRGKPARRRSRASRKAPTTLLNTDTANFRAMVQQFTGIPAPPPGSFPAGLYHPGSFGGGSFGFQVHPQPQFPVQQQEYQYHQHHQQQQHEGPLMFTLGTGSNAGGGEASSQFLQGFNGHSTSGGGVYRGNDVDMSGGFMLDGAAAPLQLIRPPPSTDTKPNGSGGGFML